jgi:beta-aspartyl-dipeptidase (metallo-type)
VFKLLKGGCCFSPAYLGKKDILTAYGKICRIESSISAEALWDVEVIDCCGAVICPCLIDQHVHISGGGGEQGPVSRTPELQIRDITEAGVGTVAGILGTDSINRSTAELLAKARALESEGITTYIYTGSYSIPPVTLTGSVSKDIAYIDKVIGVGEIAIADHRSSHPTVQSLKELAAEALTGGLVGGKPGIVHIHVGDGRDGMELLFDLIRESDFPAGMFVPTHLNRNKKLFEQALEFAKAGGNIDFTAGESSEKGLSVPDALEALISEGISTEKVTVSSDGNGSIPGSGGASGKVVQLFNDIKSCIVDKNLDIEKVLETVTLNVANVLKLSPGKGMISVNSDADILVLDENSYDIRKVIIAGKVLVDNELK